METKVVKIEESKDVIEDVGKRDGIKMDIKPNTMTKKQERSLFKKAWNQAFNEVYMNVTHQWIGIFFAVTILVYFNIVEPIVFD